MKFNCQLLAVVEMAVEIPPFETDVFRISAQTVLEHRNPVRLDTKLSIVPRQRAERGSLAMHAAVVSPHGGLSQSSGRQSAGENGQPCGFPPQGDIDQAT